MIERSDQRRTWRVMLTPRVAGAAWAAFAALLNTAAFAQSEDRADGTDGSAKAKPAHFHHVHLNVTDPQKTIDFYRRYLGAVEVRYRDRAPALFTERSFLLLEKVPEAAPDAPKSVIQHIGWAGVTGQAEYDWLVAQGVEFQTPIGQLGDNYGMYFYGPDRELIEIWTGGKHHRFDHLHLWASDVAASSKWFRDHLGLEPRVGPKPQTQDRESLGSLWMSFLQCDNVNIVFFGRPDFESVWFPGANFTPSDGPEGDFAPTRGRVIDHFGFSYREIEPVFQRMKAAGVEIVAPIGVDEETGIKSFFVQAPDGLLIEVVEERPIPEGIWED